MKFVLLVHEQVVCRQKDLKDILTADSIDRHSPAFLVRVDFMPHDVLAAHESSMCPSNVRRRQSSIDISARGCPSY